MDVSPCLVYGKRHAYYLSRRLPFSDSRQLEKGRHPYKVILSFSLGRTLSTELHGPSMLIHLCAPQNSPITVFAIDLCPQNKLTWYKRLNNQSTYYSSIRANDSLAIASLEANQYMENC